jgi:hypothetical protein
LAEPCSRASEQLDCCANVGIHRHERRNDAAEPISLCRSLVPVAAINPEEGFEKIAVAVVTPSKGITRKKVDCPWHEMRKRDLLADHDPEILRGESLDGLRPKLMATPNEVRRVLGRIGPGGRVKIVQRWLIHVSIA